MWQWLHWTEPACSWWRFASDEQIDWDLPPISARMERNCVFDVVERDDVIRLVVAWGRVLVGRSVGRRCYNWLHVVMALLPDVDECDCLVPLTNSDRASHAACCCCCCCRTPHSSHWCVLCASFLHVSHSFCESWKNHCTRGYDPITVWVYERVYLVIVHHVE